MPAITLCGDTLPPLVRIKRLTLDYELRATCLREDQDVVIVHGRKGYVNGLLMSYLNTEQEIPYVDSLRLEQLEMQDEAVLLMGNVRAHRTEEGVLRKANSEPLAGTHAEIIQRVVAATEEAITPSRNRAAFMRIGSMPQLVDESLLAALDEIESNKRMSEQFPAEAENLTIVRAKYTVRGANDIFPKHEVGNVLSDEKSGYTRKAHQSSADVVQGLAGFIHKVAQENTDNLVGKMFKVFETSILSVSDVQIGKEQKLEGAYQSSQTEDVLLEDKQKNINEYKITAGKSITPNSVQQIKDEFWEYAQFDPVKD
ncbi:MAG: hypothetical protein EZS28_033760, partial [Streblomastix strix]